MKKYILAIDEGTTSERVVLYDTTKHKIIASAGKKLTQYYPKNSYVEHDATEIWNNVYTSLCELIMKYNIKQDEVYGIGITNQRETTVAWNKKTGKPICKRGIIPKKGACGWRFPRRSSYWTSAASTTS